MSKIDIEKLWDKMFPKNSATAVDYAGRKIMKSAIGNPNSQFHPTIDHIRPISKNGSDNEENLIICHRDTNAEKADCFPTWNANGKCFQAVRIKGKRNAYTIKEI